MIGSSIILLRVLLAGTPVADISPPPALSVIVTLCSAGSPQDCVRDVVPVGTLTECNSGGASLQAYLAQHYSSSGLRVARIACQAGARV